MSEIDYLRKRVVQLEYAAKQTIGFCESVLPDTECCRYLYDCLDKKPEVDGWYSQEQKDAFLGGEGE